MLHLLHPAFTVCVNALAIKGLGANSGTFTYRALPDAFESEMNQLASSFPHSSKSEGCAMLAGIVELIGTVPTYMGTIATPCGFL